MYILSISHSVLFRMRNVSDRSCREIWNTIFISVTFFGNIAVYETMWKYTIQPDSPHDSIAEAHYMLNTYGYKHKLRICNSYCFSTATTVALTHLSIMLYIHCPSGSNTFTRQLHEVTIFASSCLSVHLSICLRDTQQLSPDSVC
jgi:hypothetical protein